MADTFQLEIVTPEKLVVKDEAEEAQIPGKNGYLGILPGHAPLISELGVGEITYRKGGMTGENAHEAVLAGNLRVIGRTVDYQFLRRRDLDLQYVSH